MLPQDFGGSTKRWIIQRLGTSYAGGTVFQALLDGLSIRELQVIRDHDDLAQRALEISRMSQEKLLEVIKEDFGLNPEDCHTGDVWVDTQDLEDRIPDWFNSQHCGWYLSFRGGEFETWARTFLMQEVRINAWMRHLKEKKSPPKQEKIYPGMYL